MVEDIGSFVRPVSIETEDDRFAVGTSNYLRVFAEDRERSRARIARQALDRLENWSAPVGCAAITHDSGRFFSIHGLADHSDRRWPVIKQPEIGILGILATRIRGVLHVLMQHKMEPGNIGGVQLSPTVQATRSNYRRIHGGGAVPYLDFFTALGMRNGARGRRVLVDSLQTEQSSLFYRKRNRNIVIEVNEEVPERPGWHWLGLDQLLGLLTIDDVVNMEARSVLCALAAEVRSAGGGLAIGGAQGTTLGDGRADREQAKHSIRGILGWITAGRSEPPQQSELVSLRELEGWSHTGELITHDSGKTFSIIGVSVRSSDREVSGWDQPMISVGADGVIGLLITEIGGVLHVLLRLAGERCGFDSAELGPTVQFEPRLQIPDARDADAGEFASEPAGPVSSEVLFLDRILDSEVEVRLFDAMASDEGGRFYRTSLRHLIVFTESDDEPPGFRWLSLDQCTELLHFGPFLNCRARSALCALFSVVGTTPAKGSGAITGTRRNTTNLRTSTSTASITGEKT